MRASAIETAGSSPGRQGGLVHLAWGRPRALLAALAAGALVAGLLPALTVSAAAAPMNMSISPNTGQADVESAYTETFKANAGVTLTNGQIKTNIPTGWTAPQSASAGEAGFVVAYRGTCSSLNSVPTVVGNQITITGVNCLAGQHLTLTYLNADPLRAGTYTFGPTSVQTSSSSSFVSINSPNVNATAGPTTKFVLSATSLTTTAGSNYSFTVTPEDDGGDVSTYSGTVAFTSTDHGASTVLPKTTSMTKATSFTAVLTTAGVQSITATDTTAVPTITGTLSNITVNPAATAYLLVSNVGTVGVTPAGEFPAGIQIGYSLTATDKYRNVTPAYAGTVTTTSSTDTHAVLPPPYTYVPATDHGAHAFRLTPMTAGSEVYGFTDSKNHLSSTWTIPVSIGVQPFTNTAFSATVGVPFSQTFTAVGATGTVHWSATGVPSWATLNSATGVMSGTPTAAGSYAPIIVTATDSATTPHTGYWGYAIIAGKGSQTISFTSSAPSAPYFQGPTYTPAATATTGQPVVFSIDSTASAVCSISGGVVSFIGTGTCTVDANQPGDSNWLAAPLAQQSFTVNGAPQSITFTSTKPTAATVGGDTYTVAATASSGLDVSFTLDSSSNGVCSISGAVVTFVGAGTCTIYANQAGDADWLAAPQQSQSFGVTGGAQTITFTSSAPTDAVVGGPTYTPTATASSHLTVTFKIDSRSASVCTIATDNTVSFTGVGECVIDADQAGDSEWYAAPEQQQSFAVGRGTQTIAFGPAPDNPQVGGSYTPSATAQGGTVTFNIDAASGSNCTISGGVVSFLAQGLCSVDGSQTGNTNWAPATNSQSFTIGAAPGAPTNCNGANKIWVGTAGDGLWTTDANWSPSGAPTSTDNVCIPNGSGAVASLQGTVNSLVALDPAGVTLTNGNQLDITGGGAAISAVNSLTFDAATLSISGVLHLQGTTTADSGTLAGSGQVYVDSSSSFEQNGTVLDGVGLHVAGGTQPGRLDWVGNEWVVQNGAAIDVHGQFNISAYGGWINRDTSNSANTPGSITIESDGQLVRDSTANNNTGGDTFYLPFTNLGSVHTVYGDLSFAGGQSAPDTGTWLADAGSTMTFSDTRAIDLSTTAASPLLLAGAGTYSITGTVTFQHDGTPIVQAENINLGAGTLAGSLKLEGSGTLAGGNVSGHLVVDSGASLDQNGATLDGGSISVLRASPTSYGQLNWTGNEWEVQNGAAIDVHGQFNISAYGGWINRDTSNSANTPGSITIESDGELVRDSTTNNNTGGDAIYSAFTNQGSVHTVFGDLSFAGGQNAPDSGTWLADAGSTMTFSDTRAIDLSTTAASPLLLAGAGTYSITGTVTFQHDGAPIVQAENINLGAGTLAGSLQLEGSGTLAGGNVSGSLVVDSGASVDQNGATLDGGQISVLRASPTSYGQLNWTANEWEVQNGAAIDVHGQFNISAYGGWINQDTSNSASTPGSITIESDGKLVRDSTTYNDGAEDTIYTPFTNQGSVHTVFGDLGFSGGQPTTAPESGYWTTDGGTQIHFADTRSFDPAPNATDCLLLAGQGKFEVDSGASLVGIGDCVSPHVQNLDFNAGVMSGIWSLDGTGTWTGGDLYRGTIYIDSGARLDRSGGTVVHDSTLWVNQGGVLDWTGGDWTVDASQIVVDGTFEVSAPGGTMAPLSAGSPSQIHITDTGQLLRDAAGSQADIDEPTTDSGQIYMKAGDLGFGDNLNVDLPAANITTFVVGAGAQLQGALHLNGATNALAGTVVVDNADGYTPSAGAVDRDLVDGTGFTGGFSNTTTNGYTIATASPTVTATHS